MRLLLSWNVRGLNNPARRKVVKDLATETHLQHCKLARDKMADIDFQTEGHFGEEKLTIRQQRY
jgi:exonuclease III